MQLGRQNKEIFQKHQKLIFPIILVLIVCVVGLSFWVVNKVSEIELEDAHYQYFVDSKREYAEGTKVKLGQYNISFHGEPGDDSGDETPVYASNMKKIILADDMYWLDLASGVEYQIPALSTVFIDDTGTAICSDGKKGARLQGGFLGNGKGLYIFLDPVTVGFGAEEKELSQLSFFSSSINDGVRVYDYENEGFTTNENLENIGYAKSDLGYQIDMIAGIYTDQQGVQRLLAASPRMLPSIFE